MDLLFLILYVVYVVLNIFDGITTWIILRPDHFSREMNPIARWIFIKLGIPRGIIITEMAVISLLTPLIFWLAANHPLMIKIALGVGVAIFSWVVGDNFLIIRKLRKRRTAQNSKH